MKHRQIILLSIFSILIVGLVVFTIYSPKPVAWVMKFRQNNITYSNSNENNKYLKNIKVSRNINYGSNYLDIIYKENEEVRPVIFFVHSGNFVAGDKEENEEYLKHLANHNFIVVNINYDLAPKKVYPYQINQIVEAYNYINKNKAKYNIDIENSYFMGDTSSTIMLSQFALAQTNIIYSNRSKIKQVVDKENFKGLILYHASFNLNNNDNSNLSDFIYNKLMWAYFGDENFNLLDSFKYTNIFEYVDTNFPDTFVLEGSNIERVATANRFSRLLNSKDVYNEIHIYNKDENFQYHLNNKESNDVINKTIAFINDRKNINN